MNELELRRRRLLHGWLLRGGGTLALLFGAGVLAALGLPHDASLPLSRRAAPGAHPTADLLLNLLAVAVTAGVYLLVALAVVVRKPRRGGPGRRAVSRQDARA